MQPVLAWQTKSPSRWQIAQAEFFLRTVMADVSIKAADSQMNPPSAPIGKVATGLKGKVKEFFNRPVLSRQTQKPERIIVPVFAAPNRAACNSKTREIARHRNLFATATGRVAILRLHGQGR